MFYFVVVFILFYFILFYFILFYFILFYFILFYFLFYVETKYYVSPVLLYSAFIIPIFIYDQYFIFSLHMAPIPYSY